MDSLLDSIGNFFGGAGAYIGNTWESAVNQLKAKAREFAELFTWLQSRAHIANSDPELRAEYNATMNRGMKIKTAVEKTTGGIDWINGQLTNRAGITMQALPAIPVALTVATITGMVAAMGYWIADAYKLKAKITYMESHGIAGQDAINILTDGGANTAISLVALAAMIYFITQR